MYVCQTLDAGGGCAAWVDLAKAATDWASVGLTSEAVAEAFFWGFTTVSVFAVSGWMIQIVRRIIRHTFEED